MPEIGKVGDDDPSHQGDADSAGSRCDLCPVLQQAGGKDNQRGLGREEVSDANLRIKEKAEVDGKEGCRRGQKQLIADELVVASLE